MSTSTTTTSSTTSTTGSQSQQQQSTQAYLQQHQIPRVLEDVVAKLAREKPSDPFTFLVSATTSTTTFPPLEHTHTYTPCLSCIQPIDSLSSGLTT